MMTSMNRRQLLQMLGLVCIPHVPIHLPRQVREDLLAVTEPRALPAMDWGDLVRTLESWGAWPWHRSTTTSHGDLGSMLMDFGHAVKWQQLALRTAPATAILVLRGNGAAFRPVEFAKVCSAIRNALDASTELWLGAAHDQALVDALRVTLVMDG